MDQGKTSISKRPYEAPTVEDVPLRPEEMVLAGCKTTRTLTGSAASGGLCSVCRTRSGS